MLVVIAKSADPKHSSNVLVFAPFADASDLFCVDLKDSGQFLLFLHL